MTWINDIAGFSGTLPTFSQKACETQCKQNTSCLTSVFDADNSMDVQTNSEEMQNKSIIVNGGDSLNKELSVAVPLTKKNINAQIDIQVEHAEMTLFHLDKIKDRAQQSGIDIKEYRNSLKRLQRKRPNEFLIKQYHHSHKKRQSKQDSLPSSSIQMDALEASKLTEKSITALSTRSLKKTEKRKKEVITDKELEAVAQLEPQEIPMKQKLAISGLEKGRYARVKRKFIAQKFIHQVVGQGLTETNNSTTVENSFSEKELFSSTANASVSQKLSTPMNFKKKKEGVDNKKLAVATTNKFIQKAKQKELLYSQMLPCLSEINYVTNSPDFDENVKLKLHYILTTNIQIFKLMQLMKTGYAYRKVLKLAEGKVKQDKNDKISIEQLNSGYQIYLLQQTLTNFELYGADSQMAEICNRKLQMLTVLAKQLNTEVT